MLAKRFNFARTLHGRLLLALLLIGIIPLGLIGLGISVLDRRSIGEQSARELIGLARGLAGQLHVHVTGLLENARAISALPEITGMDRARQSALLKELFLHYPTFARLSVFDRTGRRVASSHVGGAPSIAARKSFQTAIGRGHQSWEVAHALTTGRSSLLIHTPIRDAERRVVGVLDAVVDLEDISVAVNRVHVGGRGQAFVLDAAGRVLLHREKAAVQKRLDYSWIGIPAGGRLAGPGTIRYDAAGESRIAGYAPIPNTGWTVVVERPEADILVPAKRSFRLALTGLAISVTLALAAAAFFALKLTRPVRELAQAARALASGDPSAALPLFPREKSELGLLVESFDAMRVAVKSREETLTVRARQQAVVTDLGQRALVGTEPLTLMDEAVALVAETLSVDYCKVLELLPDGEALLLRAGVGWKEGYVGRATVGAGADSQAGYTLLSNGPVIVEDLQTETRFSGPPLLRDHGVFSGVSVVIHGKERPFGVMGVHTSKRRIFTDNDVHFLQAVANVLASAIERRRAEEGLRKLSSAVEQTADSVFITDREGVIEYVNPAFEELTGYSKVEVVGKKPSILKSGKHDDGFYKDLWDTILAGKGFRAVMINKKKDGELYYEEKTITPLKDPQGRITHFVSTGKDITERKKAEEEIQRSLERIRVLREIDTAITSTLDLPTVLDLLLEKIDSLLPYDASAILLLNKESGELESAAFRNIAKEKWQEHIARIRSGDSLARRVVETRFPLVIGKVQSDARTRDQEFFIEQGFVSYLSIPLTDKGEALGVLALYTKEERAFSNEEVEFISTLAAQAAMAIHNSQLYEEMAKLAGDLSKSNKVKDEFLSVMSHELRTPLNVVLGYTGMIKDRMLGEISPEQERALDKVTNHSRDLLTMISGILEATQIEAEVRVERNDVNLVRFLDELKSAYNAPSDKKLGLVWNYPSDLPVVKTDGEKLGRILRNLINNAIKFTEKGSVTISARCLFPTPDSPMIEFKVADTGIGIAKEFLSIIFEKFRQVDSSETRPYGGMGLGLYIVKKYTELLGGRVQVESEPGQGSTFAVTLPCEITKEPPHTVEQTEVHMKKQILLVEDNPATIDVVEQELEFLGYEVAVAKNGVEAVRMAESYLPDLILMDILMPTMDGLEAVSRIRRTPKTAFIPILACTAKALPGDRETCLRSGCDDYIAKPFTHRELGAAIEKLLTKTSGQIS